MEHYLLVVEGGHDAAFFGKLLKRRGFSVVSKFGELPEFWTHLIPRQFPVSKDGRLDRIIVYPEVYADLNNNRTFGISVSGSESNLIGALRRPIEIHSLSAFTGVGIALDTDLVLSEMERFNRFMQTVRAWIDEGVKDKIPGFPLILPKEPNVVSPGRPRFGIYQFPGNDESGSLEDVLLACAEKSYPNLPDMANSFLDRVHVAFRDLEDISESQFGSGRKKASCGVIANTIKPGSSLAVSLRQSGWLPKHEDDVPALKAAAVFLDQLLYKDDVG